MAATYFHGELVVPQPPPPLQDPALPSPETSFSAYPQSSPLSTPPNTLISPPFATDHPQTAIPKVGQTRCYWALLSADLQFIYLDPVLAGHLEDQADSLVGQSLLTYVHPDERESARQDLGSVLDSKTLHGSVTRVRFSRLSKVRNDLGYTGPGTPWSEADKIALDEQYMAVEIVINWAADGLVLCFIHASVDLSPSDNDEQQRTQWTNWCGTPFMSQDQVSLLFRRLLLCIPQTGTTNRVFQILSNDPGRSILLSWPPDPSHLAEVSAVDLAKLVDDVNLDTALSGVSNDAKTSCTRRFKALKHDIPTFGGQVESIFIPHGSIIFACHKVSPSSRGPVNSTSGMQQVALAPSYNSQPASASYYDPNPYPLTLPPISTTQEPHSYMAQHHQGPQYSPHRWSSSVPAALSNLRSNSYVQQAGQQDQSWQAPRAQLTYVEAPSSNRGGDSPTYTLYSPTTTVSGTSPTTDNVVPPPKRKLSPSSTKGEHASGGRNSANRPAGLLMCSSCKTTNSPEWRKGPSGKKELCNACGLRYARSRAKKEGHQTQSQRRRKTSTTAKQGLLSTTSPYNGTVRRLYDAGSYPSAGPPPSADTYSHTNGGMGQDLSPSPSPPGTTMSFLPYPDSRPYADSGSFYTTSPSTLSSSAISHANEPSLSSQMSSGHHAMPQLPPISTYVDRLVPSGSPLTHASFPATLPSASYERDRERDRDYRSLLPTPLSAEPRMKREILSQH